MIFLRTPMRLSLLIVWVFCLFWPILLLWALGLDILRGRLVRIFYAGTGWIVGLRLSIEGEISAARPLMIVANHTSYLDVLVLGALVPMSFTPKKEVRSWPVIGFFCVLADCVFVERKPSEMNEARAGMEKRLKKGKVLCLFPEGTTSDGKHLKPFKSGFLSLAEAYALPVQPVTVAYTHIGGEPLVEARREEVAWVGEASFFAHFIHMMGFPSVHVRIITHPPLALKNFADRKALTKACEERIVSTLNKALSHAG